MYVYKSSQRSYSSSIWSRKSESREQYYEIKRKRDLVLIVSHWSPKGFVKGPIRCGNVCCFSSQKWGDLFSRQCFFALFFFFFAFHLASHIYLCLFVCYVAPWSNYYCQQKNKRNCVAYRRISNVSCWLSDQISSRWHKPL